MRMTIPEEIITILLCTLATMITRFLPFIVFSEKTKTPYFIVYLGKWLPSAVFAMLVVYCVRNVEFFSGNLWIFELTAIFATAITHLIKKNLMLSMLVGTGVYMVLTGFFVA